MEWRRLVPGNCCRRKAGTRILASARTCSSRAFSHGGFRMESAARTGALESFDPEQAVARYRNVTARLDAESTEAGRAEFQSIARRPAEVLGRMAGRGLPARDGIRRARRVTLHR